MSPLPTLPYPQTPTPDSRVLVIGHDPRLRESDALAQHAFFADLFFRPVPRKAGELARYGLASTVYAYIAELTSYRYTAKQLVLTNLCNEHLPHAPKGKVVLIPEAFAVHGLAEIRRILSGSPIGLVLAMSEQVNYWLQALGFCSPSEDFIRKAAPKVRGVTTKPPFYEPKEPRAFQLIAFRRHTTSDGIPLYPIVHVGSWPLKGPFKKAYARPYKDCVSELKMAGA